MKADRSRLPATVGTIAQAVQHGRCSAEAVTRAALKRIAAHNPTLNAYLHVAHEHALRQARAIDEKRARGKTLGPLAGVPIGLKDALCTQHMPTTAASRILTRDGRAASGYRPPYDATVVSRLRAADAVLVGKCNMDELAMGSSTENSAFGPSLNPHDHRRTPGGSSGGSAVSVAAGMTPAALGSDTGGSVRQPAALCGCVGIKPSYGRVSRYGLIAFASSLDQVGPLANDVRGAALLLQVISGHDPCDATSRQLPPPDYLAACELPARGLRVGIPKEYFGEGLQPQVAALVRRALERLQADGASMVPIDMPHTYLAVATYYVLATAECSSNLARFDGVRYGLRVDQKDIQSMYRHTRSEGFGAEVKRRILLGTYVLSKGYYDAYYLRAQRVRTLIKRDFEEAFRKVDVLASPVSPTLAFRLGAKTRQPLSMYLADVYTLPASLAGVAAVSVPCGVADDSTLPVGLQLVAPSHDEGAMLRAAAAVERQQHATAP